MGKIKQICVIQSDSSIDFQNQVNEAMKKFADCEPELSVSMESFQFRAVITYEGQAEESNPGRTVKEQFHDDGLRFVCEQCKHFESRGDRVRWGRCKYAIGTITHKDTECCEYFYKLLAQGEIDPK